MTSANGKTLQFSRIRTINRRSRLTRLVPNDVWDVKEPTNCSKRLGDVVPSGVAWSFVYHMLMYTCKVTGNSSSQVSSPLETIL